MRAAGEEAVNRQPEPEGFPDNRRCCRCSRVHRGFESYRAVMRLEPEVEGGTGRVFVVNDLCHECLEELRATGRAYE